MVLLFNSCLNNDNFAKLSALNDDSGNSVHSTFLFVTTFRDSNHPILYRSADGRGRAAPDGDQRLMSQFFHGADYLLDRSLDIASVDLPERARSTDGMVSERERRLAYLLARDHYQGGGFIIDGGMLLGSSGVSLAEGLLANPAYREGRVGLSHRRPIVGYEMGVLPANGPKPQELEVGGTTIRFGESFAPVLLGNVAPYREVLEVRIGDLLEQFWDPQDPIKILFVDVAKTPLLNQHVFEQFFPCLVPGESLIVQQDFFFDRLPWIKVLMGYLADHFEWLGQVGPSSVYRYVKAIPPHMFAVDPYRDLPKKERLRLHALAQDARLPDRRRFALDVSLAYLHAELDGAAAGARQLELTVDQYTDYIHDPKAGASALTRLTRARRAMGLLTPAQPSRIAPRPAPKAQPVPRPEPAAPSLAELRAQLESLVAMGQDALSKLDAIEKASSRPAARRQSA